jgi:alkanesulfonate monooxygenase SsuD/methylene tetrahydromethanopterin reductase-like flavin-dependent oxidoreductase (luciferase family)
MASLLSHIRFLAGLLVLAVTVLLTSPASAQHVNPTADSVNEERLLGQLKRISERTISNPTGNRGPLPPPMEDFESRLDARGRMILQHALTCSVVGAPEKVKRGLAAFIERTSADEIMVAGHIYDHAARVRSHEIAAEVHGLKFERCKNF